MILERGKWRERKKHRYEREIVILNVPQWGIEPLIWVCALTRNLIHYLFGLWDKFQPTKPYWPGPLFILFVLKHLSMYRKFYILLVYGFLKYIFY